MSYYYLAASLPALSLDHPPALSWMEFRALCADHLRATDLVALDQLDGGNRPASTHPFVRNWQRSETRIRNAVARRRGARRGRDASVFLREQIGVDLQCEARVEQAFARANPLERERDLDAWRWECAERLAGYDPFSSSALLAYGLKLLLAERWQAIDIETGRERAEKIIRTNPDDGQAARDTAAAETGREALKAEQ